jgi:genome maintenance exonuclease 1
MADIIIENGLKDVNEVWAMEQSLYFPGLYSGTTDLVGVYDGEPAVMDHKQTNKPKKREWVEDYFMQLMAYILAHNEVYGTNIRKGVVLMCVKPPVDDMGNPLARPVYQEFVLKPEDFDYWSDQWWRRLEQYYLLI